MAVQNDAKVTDRKETIPFPVSADCSGFGQHGFSADHITQAFNAAVQNEIKDKLQRGMPIARYDVDRKQAYLESADGTKEYIDG